MKTADLEAEYDAAVKNLTTEDAKELCDQLQIPLMLVIIHRMIGLLPVRMDRSGYLWEPDSDSEQWAYITPLRIDRADTVLSVEPWGTPRCGNLVDLIAWDPRAPGRWALRTGASTWLGAVPIEPFPAVIRASPLSWLRADCEGLVLLTRDPPQLRAILVELEHGIDCESPALTARLNKLVRQPVANAPRIVSPPYLRSASRARARGYEQPVDIPEDNGNYTPLRTDAAAIDINGLDGLSRASAHAREAPQLFDNPEDRGDYAALHQEFEAAVSHINGLDNLSRTHAPAREDTQPVENGQDAAPQSRVNGFGRNFGPGSHRRRAAMALWGPTADSKGD